MLLSTMQGSLFLDYQGDQVSIHSFIFAAATACSLIGVTINFCDRAEGIMNVISTNFFSAVNITNAILLHMPDHCKGCLVFIGSHSIFCNQKIVRVLAIQCSTVTSSCILTPGFLPPRGLVRSLYWMWQLQSTHPSPPTKPFAACSHPCPQLPPWLVSCP